MSDPKWIPRLLRGRLKAALRQFPVVLVSGARQVGKTALCRRTWPEAGYVTLDLPAEAEAAEKDAEAFLDRHPAPLIVDEIQYAPSLLRHMKVRVDRDRKAGRYLITGSQDFALMQGVTESLAGRCAVLKLAPLGMEEAGVADNDALDAFAWRGGWPELQARADLDRDLWMGSYLTTYLERDVRNLLNVGNLRDFDRFLRAAAYRAGQMLSLSEMARDVGVAVNTAKSWLSLLQASHQIFLLEPWHVNPGKRLVKTPKLYFEDVGFLLYLLGFSSWRDAVANPAWGAIWENLVIAECRKAMLNAGKPPRMYYWRTADGREVDLLSEIGHRRVKAFEIKAAEHPDAGALKGLNAFARAYGPGCVAEQAVICRTRVPHPLATPETQAIPLAVAVRRIALHSARSERVESAL
jgi:uncharacterized protein